MWIPAKERTTSCVDKALEIPIVQSTTDSAFYAYNFIKKQNRLSSLGFSFLEMSVRVVVRGLNPLVARLQGPIDMADAVICIMLEDAKSKFPVITEPSGKVMEAAKAVVLQSPVTRKALLNVDKLFELAESVCSVIPTVSAMNDVTASTGNNAFSPVKSGYFIATWPLRVTVDFIHAKRSAISELSYEVSESLLVPNVPNPSITEKQLMSPRRRIETKTFAQQLFTFPRYLLQTIGKVTCDKSEQKYYNENLRNVPNVPDVMRPEEKKRKYDEVSDSEFSETDEQINTEEEEEVDDENAGNEREDLFSADEEVPANELSPSVQNGHDSESATEETDSPVIDNGGSEMPDSARPDYLDSMVIIDAEDASHN